MVCPIVDLTRPWVVEGSPDTEVPDLIMPEIEKSVRPDFGVNGQVHLRQRPVFQLVIDPTGGVDRIGLIRGERDGLLDAVIESLTKFEFTPATHRGKPICATFVVSTSAHY
jgi:hypothetical protein